MGTGWNYNLSCPGKQWQSHKTFCEQRAGQEQQGLDQNQNKKGESQEFLHFLVISQGIPMPWEMEHGIFCTSFFPLLHSLHSNSSKFCQLLKWPLLPPNSTASKWLWAQHRGCCSGPVPAGCQGLFSTSTESHQKQEKGNQWEREKQPGWNSEPIQLSCEWFKSLLSESNKPDFLFYITQWNKISYYLDLNNFGVFWFMTVPCLRSQIWTTGSKCLFVYQWSQLSPLNTWPDKYCLNGYALFFQKVFFSMFWAITPLMDPCGSPGRFLLTVMTKIPVLGN